MSKIISTKKINSCFLAIVLIVGTLAAISPSFMVGAHAQQYGMDQKYNSYEQDYGMDNSYDDKQSYGKDTNSYDKSKDSSTIVKKVKCNNINANLNGFNGVDINALPTALRGLATEVQATEDEGEIGASSSGSDGGRPSGSDSDYRFECIDNNDFVVVGGEEEPISELCEECFAANSRLHTAILNFLVEFDGVSISQFFSEDGIGEIFFTATETNTIEQLCAQIESAVEIQGVPLSDEVIEEFFNFVLGGGFEAEIEALVECLLEAGLIVDREPPPETSSAAGLDNGLRASGTVQCTGDPLCAKLEQQ